MPILTLSPELTYVAVVIGIFIVPRVLQRFRIPGAVTCVALGAAVGIGYGALQGDETVHLLSTLGISALFLFAGLEVDFSELRGSLRVLVQHVVIQVALLALATVAVERLFGLELRAAVLMALALVTPSTGFILDSLAGLDLTDSQRFWVKSKAIATELVALAVMFVTLQSASLERLATSSGVLVVMVLALPFVFRLFASGVLPYAPKSEFAFLVIVALICAYVTRSLGVYYLVGAFVVGVTAQRFRRQLPSIASADMLRSVEMFASFFIPFYFFSAGLHLTRDDLSLDSLVVGAGFLATMIPVRIAAVAFHRRAALAEPMRDSVRIAVTMLPTLVFTLVIAGVLREQFALSDPLFGGLVIWTLANTLLPGFFFRLPPPEFETPEAPA